MVTSLIFQLLENSLRKVNNFTIQVLGSASAQPSVSRHSSAQCAQVHGRLFLLDCSEGTQIRLREAHINFRSIDIICITHAHGDHSFGLFGLLSTMGMLGRTNDLHVYAPADVKRIIDFYRQEFGSQDKYEIIFHELASSEPEVVFETRNVQLTAIPLRHSITTYGFIIREKSTRRTPRSYAYISDTAPFPQEAEWLQGVQVLYHEATYPVEKQLNGKKYCHSTTVDAASLAAKIGAEKLYIGHFSAAFRDTSVFDHECREVFEASYVVNDLETIEIY